LTADRYDLAAMPETMYARRGDDHIAYQVIGSGPIDLVFMNAWFSHIDGRWDEPRFAKFLRQLSSFSRLILFDKRGTGASDALPAGDPSWEDWADDVRTVMDAVGSERAAVVGVDLVAVKAHGHAVTQGAHRGRTGVATHQRHFAKTLAGAQTGQFHLGAVEKFFDPHLTRHQHIKGAANVALVEHQFPGGHRKMVGRGQRGKQAVGGHAGKDRHVALDLVDD